MKENATCKYGFNIRLVASLTAGKSFFYVVPSNEETSFQPLSMVCISVILHFAHYKLQILNGPLCAAYCVLDLLCVTPTRE